MAMQAGGAVSALVAMFLAIITVVWGLASLSADGDTAIARWLFSLPFAIVFFVGFIVLTWWLFKAANEKQRLSRAARRYVGWRRNQGQT